MPSPPQPPAVAWAPAKLTAPTTGTPNAAVPRELLELAKQLALVEHQRQQLLLKAASSPPTSSPTSPIRQPHLRRPSSPATALLSPLPVSPTSPKSVSLAPALVARDVVVCEVCGAELLTMTHLRTHKTSSCPMRVVSCPRAGCGLTFLAHERAAHDRDACVARRRTQQLLDAHAEAHALIPCSVCGEAVDARTLHDHKQFVCSKREVACLLEAFGCRERFPLDQRELHETSHCRVAQHRAKVRADAAFVNETIACDWCGHDILKRKLLDHQEEACPKRERPCPNAANGCTEWVPADATDAHVQTTCVVTVERNAMAARAREMHTLVACTECGASVSRRFLAAHEARECVSRVVACKNAAHGCRMRLRWRDRHLHEDFMTLASRDRSALQFPVGGHAYVVMQPSKPQADLPPPWTLELFLWLVNAADEILDLHAKALDLVETVVVKQRDHARYTQQANICKKKLKQLKQVHKADAARARPSQILGDVAAAAKTLADDFHAADAGVTEAMEAMALAKGRIQILITDALGLLDEERVRDADVAMDIRRRIESQALDRLTTRELLGSEFLSEDEQLRLGDVDRWAAAVAPLAKSNDRTATAEKQQQALEQRKLLDKRSEMQQALDQLHTQEADGEVTEAEAMRLRRRHERELAKLDAKLALVSNSTPAVLLDRQGRHVIASSARNAIVLSGVTHHRIAYVRSVAGANANVSPRGEVDFQLLLARNRWHHVAFCASPRELTLVVNGEIKTMKRGVFELPFARLGSNHEDESFQGLLQEVRVWKRCLSREYLVANATRIVDVQRQRGDLLAYYTFEEGAGDVVDDMALMQPRAACVNTQWVLYNSPAIRQQLGLPPTPSLRDKTSCVVNQRLKLLAQRANDRTTEPLACRQQCGTTLQLRELEIHQRMHCENRLVVCSEIGCEKLFRHSDRSRHLATECEPHAYRETLVKRREKRETLEPCLLRCGAMIKWRHVEKHYTHECPHRLVACPQHDCGESVIAQDVQKHVDNDCKSVDLLAKRTMVENARKRQQQRVLFSTE